LRESVYSLIYKTDVMKFLILLSLTTLSFSCANPIKKAVNKAKYEAYEMVGMEKRDLFKKEVANVKEEQEETGEAFKDALTKLKEIYLFDGGDLEKAHGKLNSSYEEAKEKSKNVSGRITQLDTVAQDLFTEWQNEIQEISSADLKSKSRDRLAETRQKYNQLHKQLKTSEAKIAPVLSKLKDQVLYMKHNLNAKAIGGLKTESAKIQNDIEKLMNEMKESNAKAESLMREL